LFHDERCELCRQIKVQTETRHDPNFDMTQSVGDIGNESSPLRNAATHAGHLCEAIQSRGFSTRDFLAYLPAK
jgi:hypothetical protein